jgi:hypothetical protein
VLLTSFASAVIIGTHDHAHKNTVELQDIFYNVQKIVLILKAAVSTTHCNKSDFLAVQSAGFIYICTCIKYMNFGRVHLR